MSMLLFFFVCVLFFFFLPLKNMKAIRLKAVEKQAVA